MSLGLCLGLNFDLGLVGWPNSAPVVPRCDLRLGTAAARSPLEHGGQDVYGFLA